MAFTALQGSLFLVIILIYKSGISKEMRQKISYKPYLIGIAGDSGSGKSFTAALIARVFGQDNTLEVAGDDMHRWERGDEHWSQITHLNPKANRLHDDMEQLLKLKRNESVFRKVYDHSVGKFDKSRRIQPKKVIIFEGLHTLFLARARESLDLKIFLSPNEELRRTWKVERDQKERGHSKEVTLRALDARARDALNYISEQEEYADIILSYGGERGEELTIKFDNSVHADSLIETLRMQDKLEISHEHSAVNQYLNVKGGISSEAVDLLAYTLIPELWDIEAHPQWEGGLSGILQLFVSYTILYRARLEHDFL